MATFKVCVRDKSADNLYNVYIRVTHNRAVGYIRTTLRVSSKGINKKGEITENNVILKCTNLILSFNERLNGIDYSVWNIIEIVNYLKQGEESISFTDFTSQFINRLENEGRKNSAGNYKNAIRSLKEFLCKDSFDFSELTKKRIQDWIYSLKKTNRAKNLYPVCIKALFEAGEREYNDYDRGIIKIKNRPFYGIKIPKNTLPKKKAVSHEIIKTVLLSATEGIRAEIARDVAFLVFCLAGINTADLYDLEKDNLKGWKLCYNRKKTRSTRLDKARIEITVPAIIRPIFEKYKGKGEALFSFSERYSTPEDFNKYVNKGLKAICDKINVDKVTTYTFRHTWATIAQNDCGASTEQIAFALNHSSAHKVTEGYIKKDFSPIDKLNKEVINFVFEK